MIQKMVEGWRQGTEKMRGRWRWKTKKWRGEMYDKKMGGGKDSPQGVFGTLPYCSIFIK